MSGCVVIQHETDNVFFMKPVGPISSGFKERRSEAERGEINTSEGLTIILLQAFPVSTPYPRCYTEGRDKTRVSLSRSYLYLYRHPPTIHGVASEASKGWIGKQAPSGKERTEEPDQDPKNTMIQ